ncbi:hypothetical protein [Bradyrhizobium pachyrhizi]|uniref:hypothetical protein n=1 Tax=Bradyrhizobium pachyrhizi TaxID=280333 RepID=UPI00067B9F3A|nr:hypothetical protein [Bradyrhizobium pachyrhizi]
MTAKRQARARLLALCLASPVILLDIPESFAADASEPIAYIGHGAFFDNSGNQIKLTQEFIEKAQAYYRQRLLSSMPADKATAFSDAEKGVSQPSTSSRQNNLVLQNRSLRSLTRHSTDPDAGRIASILNALDYALKSQIPERADTGVPTRKFIPEPQVREFLEKQTFQLQQALPLANTTKGGQQYIDECRSNGVPIPPPVGKLDPAGTAGWRSLGFIPKEAQFIVGSPAEVRVFTSATPAGMCIALPRYADDSKQSVALDGVICLGQLTSKVCFWDNQMPASDGQGGTQGVTFEFATGEQIPIGVPDLKIDPKGRFQGGGFDLNNGQGGVCTNCHAGENPYIIHPKVDLGGGLLMGKLNKPPLNLPTFSTDRYDPFVPPSWPQNATSEAAAKVPSACGVCHEKDGPGGRFPQLSTALQGYCGTILRQAIEKTMPPGNPGSLQNDPEVKNFLALCLASPDVSMADSTP